MKILRGDEVLAASQQLLDVFRDGYGGSFVGDERFQDNYIAKAQMAVVDDALPELKGATLLRDTRITSVATRSDRFKFGSRFSNLVNLLENSHLVDNQAWISIGLDAKASIKAAADRAGMSRSKNEELLERRLMAFGLLSRYTIRRAITGLEIMLNSSQMKGEYWQEVWDWGQ